LYKNGAVVRQVTGSAPANAARLDQGTGVASVGEARTKWKACVSVATPILIGQCTQEWKV
jgi:hypothetical protein